MTNIILFVILAVIITAAAVYIYKAKKRGVKCVGCPAGATCGSCQSGGSCNCGSGGAGSCGCYSEAD